MAIRSIITGSEGLIGRALFNTDEFSMGYGTSINVCSRSTVKSILEYKPELVIHCAAYTKVDLAETNKAECYGVNVWGTKNIAEACRELDIPMVFFSTDAVFNGIPIYGTPFEPGDIKSPVSVYGKSKAEAEDIVRVLPKHFIVRTNWVFGSRRSNFITQAAQKFRDNKGSNNPVEIATIDQVGTPTHVNDLCSFVKDLIKTEDYGIHHFTNSGEANRREVITYMAGLFNQSVLFSNYEGASAYRGRYTTLKLAVDSPHWMESLRGFCGSSIV